MNANALVQAIVRQTTVLIAQLATTAGLRAPLVDVADQVFLDLVNELKAQGLRQKVIADMFGMALRSYQLKVQRLTDTASDRARSLWEATLTYLQARRVATQAELLQHFRHQDEPMFRGVLRDLVESGLVFQAGRGNATAYRAASDEELGLLGRHVQKEGAQALVWLTIYRSGAVTRASLNEQLGLDAPILDEALTTLLAEQRIAATGSGDATAYLCEAFTHELGSPVGWEAAVFDHYQAVVTTICTKLRRQQSAAASDLIGGSTYSFDISPGHPLADEVSGLLREVRERAGRLKSAVLEYNEANPQPDEAARFTFYVGQTVADPHADVEPAAVAAQEA